jgi:hypothetical protein
VSPVAVALNTVSRTLGSFHPGAMPRMARLHYRRELVAWLFLPIMMGAVEGGVVSVVAKNIFAGSVPERSLNFAVALLAGAPAFANVTSFLWAALSHGRNKIRFLAGLQVAAVLLIAHVAFAPKSTLGLVMVLIGAIGARVCWSGVITVRATVWQANYPRAVRASMAGKLATVQAIMLASVGLAIGLALRVDESSFRLLYPLAAGFGLLGAVVYSRMRMRGHAALVGQERRDAADSSSFGGFRMWSILARDRAYRRYMIAMFVFGIGNLMVTAPMVIMLRDVFGFGYLGGILVMATIPIILMPLSIPIWSRLLDGVHVVRFRVFHCWTFVAATAAATAAALTRDPIYLWIFAACKGMAFGGGVLGWNLGHLDYASIDRSAQYMGVHVTLTGIRGVIGPLAAVAIYEWLETTNPGAGWGVFALCLGLNLVGAAGFIVLNRLHSRQES